MWLANWCGQRCPPAWGRGRQPRLQAVLQEPRGVVALPRPPLPAKHNNKPPQTMAVGRQLQGRRQVRAARPSPSCADVLLRRCAHRDAHAPTSARGCGAAAAQTAASAENLATCRVALSQSPPGPRTAVRLPLPQRGTVLGVRARTQIAPREGRRGGRLAETNPTRQRKMRQGQRAASGASGGRRQKEEDRWWAGAADVSGRAGPWRREQRKRRPRGGAD